MKNENMEVEARSFIDEAKYDDILSKLNIDAEFVGELNEETIYFSSDRDLRLRKNEKGVFLILKEGKIHDKFRRETEIKFSVSEFENMQEFLTLLGYGVEIKWFRKRLEFKQGNIKFFLDDTRGYGKIIETEMIVKKGDEKRAYEELVKKIEDLGVTITEKNEFDAAFEHYKKNWRELIK